MRTSLVLLLVLAGCARVAPPVTPAPELGKRVVAEHGAVASASPYASEAGVAMLRAGGNAVDAAVATAFAVGVAEPEMSGIGGGGAALVWLQSKQRAEYLDFYSAQNAAPYRNLQDGPRKDLRVVAIPGSVAGLLELQQRYGKLTRAQVLAPAIRLAEEGYPINQVLAEFIADDSAKINRYPKSAAFLWPGGRPVAVGTVVKNPELAAVLRRVAEQGRDGFYRGETAQQLIATLNEGGHPARVEDITDFPLRWKRPLCIEYRGSAVLSAPPPQTGQQVLHTLQLLEPYDLRALGLPTQSPRAFDIVTSALRVGLADNRGNDDPRWRAVPAVGTTSAAYAQQRAALIGTGKAADRIEGGDATSHDSVTPEAACAAYEPYTPERPGTGVSAPDAGSQPTTGETTHISVVDGEGNAVALTQTNSSTFGSGAMVSGFFLNDSGYRFDQPGALDAVSSTTWRTRPSTISPTIVLRDGKVELVVGSPGAGRIPPAVTQVISYVLDYGLDPLDAVRMPRIFPNTNNTNVELEHGYPASTLAAINAMGYRATPAAGYARVYVIARQHGRWIAAADPRHDGGAVGY